VLPRNRGAGWESFSDDDHERFVDRLGNQVLLQPEVNRRLGTQPFALKVEAYRESAFPTTRLAAEYGEWTPEAIQARQARLAELAVAAWRVEV
jgi:hypothetical protein